MKDFRDWGVKMRYLPENNYKALWFNLKTIRLGEGRATELPPNLSEFYDVSLGNKCQTGKCNFCLVPSTKITTMSGNISIENIKEGDFVYSFNENTGDTEIKQVDQIFKREIDEELIEIELENTVLRLTSNHKVYTKNRGWVEAENLQLSDTLIKF